MTDGYDFRAHRLYVDGDMTAGATLPLSKEQANYLVNVLRLGNGAAVHIFNGRDGEWRALLRPAGRRDVALEVETRIRPQSGGPDLYYVFAPLKRTRLDYMVQKATEMGASRLCPIITQHTVAERINLDRMRANVVEAAEQCGILRIPAVAEPVSFTRILESWDASRRLVFCDENAPVQDPIETLQQVAPGPLAVLVGPEGGFSGDERAHLVAKPYVVRLALGPRIMRADTAAVAALALVEAVLGDWRPETAMP